MSDNVRQLNPTNARDIPMMLRFWAAEFEAGREAMPRAAILIMVPEGIGFPDLAVFGEQLGPLEEIGVLHALAVQASQPELVPVR